MLVGCADQTVSDPPEPAPPATSVQSEEPAKDPAPVTSAVYDQLHAALFQADAAVEKIRKALDAAHEVEPKLPPDVAADVQDMIATLDDDGATLADRVGEDLPPVEEVAKDEAKYKGRVVELLSTIEDILKDVREQEGVAASLAEMGPPATVKDFEAIDELLCQAIDDLIEAKKTLGGT